MVKRDLVRINYLAWEHNTLTARLLNAKFSPLTINNVPTSFFLSIKKATSESKKNMFKSLTSTWYVQQTYCLQSVVYRKDSLLKSVYLIFLAADTQEHLPSEKRNCKLFLYHSWLKYLKTRFYFRRVKPCMHTGN